MGSGMNEFLETAREAALEAGEVHAKYFDRDLQIDEKSGTHDLVTEADFESERIIVETIRQQFPDHNFLAEEERYETTDSEYTWIIDPLDGTNNFASGIPVFCASVALACKGELIAGAIYDLTRDELFYASPGEGAYLNGQRIRVNDAGILSQAILATGFFYDRGPDMKNTLRNIEKFFLSDVRGIRRFGAAALDMAYVASGRFTGFWEFSLHPWDFAAGKLIVEEAGGMVTGLHGEELPLESHYVVASNGSIHQHILDVLNSAGSPEA